MTEPTITCPNCKTEIRLTESLAAPLIAATREQFEKQLLQKDTDIAKREQLLRDKEKVVAEEKRKLDAEVADQVAKQLKEERALVVAEEARKAKLASATELEDKARELLELQEVLKSREEKLAEAQNAQAELINDLPPIKESNLNSDSAIHNGLFYWRSQDGAEELFNRTNHWIFAAGGSSAVAGQAAGCGHSRDRCDAEHLLPLAQGLRRAEAGPRQAAEGAGA